jgi:hypothetical protein
LLALARPSCHRCGGLGVLENRGTGRACACVARRVFAECLASYRHCRQTMTACGNVQYERIGHAQGRCAIVASFKRAEYAADFVMAAARALADRPIEHAVFRAFHLRGLEWSDAVAVVNRELRMIAHPLNKGSFFNSVYRVEEVIGHFILAMKPYSLYPARDYFAGTVLPAIAHANRPR